MRTQKYTVIKTEKQYKEYCKVLEDLVVHDNEKLYDEIELLNLLIEKWDQDHQTFRDLDPIELLKALMEENKLKSKDIADILNLSKGTISKILSYQKGLSKQSIRKLSEYFKVAQEAFNRPYHLTDRISGYRNAC